MIRTPTPVGGPVPSGGLTGDVLTKLDDNSQGECDWAKRETDPGAAAGLIKVVKLEADVPVDANSAAVLFRELVTLPPGRRRIRMTIWGGVVATRSAPITGPFQLLAREQQRGGQLLPNDGSSGGDGSGGGSAPCFATGRIRVPSNPGGRVLVQTNQMKEPPCCVLPGSGCTYLPTEDAFESGGSIVFAARALLPGPIGNAPAGASVGPVFVTFPSGVSGSGDKPGVIEPGGMSGGIDAEPKQATPAMRASGWILYAGPVTGPAPGPNLYWRSDGAEYAELASLRSGAAPNEMGGIISRGVAGSTGFAAAGNCEPGAILRSATGDFKVGPAGLTGGADATDGASGTESQRSATASAIDVIDEVDGGAQVLLVQFQSPSAPNVTLCGKDGAAPDLCWTMAIEDLGGIPS